MGEPLDVKTEQQLSALYEFGEYRIGTVERLLRRSEEIIHLPPKVIDLLLVLVESGGRVLTKDELMERVWADSFVEETNLTHNISLLRRTLGEKKNGEKFIETIPRRGYRFVAPVEKLEKENFEIIARERTVTNVVTEEELETSDAPPGNEKVTDAPRRGFRNNPIFAPSILVIAALIGAGIYAWRERTAGKTLLPFQQISVKQLTDSGLVITAALSPDGKLFAFTVLDKEGRESLKLGHVDGSREIELRPPSEKLFRGFRFTPDSSYLYFTENDNFVPGVLYKIPVLGGVPEKIEEDVPRNSVLSPDFSRLAFVRRDEANQKSVLLVKDFKSDAEREVATRPANLDFIFTSPAWSADGNLIAVGAVTDEASEKKEIFVVSPADGTVKSLTNQAWKAISAIHWFKDGSGLVVVAADRGSLWFATQIWHVSYPEGDARRITSDLNIYGFEISASADDSSLVTVMGQFYSNIWVAPADNLSAAKQVTFDSVGKASGWEGLAWLPDGRIVYTGMTDKQISLWSMDADGRNQKQMTSSGYTDRSPTISTDGKIIVFESDRGGKSFDIWRTNAEGDLRQLTFGAKTSQPSVSPDGSWITYIGQQDGKKGLWRISTEGGAEPVFLNYKVIASPQFSPDSKFIAVGFNDEGKRKLAVLSAENGEVVKLFDVPRLHNFSGGLKWTPDGKAVTYRDIIGGIWKQLFDGGAPERIEGLPNERIYGYDWSPDGKSFAFTRGDDNRVVVLIRSSKAN